MTVQRNIQFGGSMLMARFRERSRGSRLSRTTVKMRIQNLTLSLRLPAILPHKGSLRISAVRIHLNSVPLQKRRYDCSLRDDLFTVCICVAERHLPSYFFPGMNAVPLQFIVSIVTEMLRVDIRLYLRYFPRHQETFCGLL